MPTTALNTIETRFDGSTEGWSITSDGTNLTWVSDGAGGGYIQATDAINGPLFYYQAASSFLGDRSSFFGGTLSFDLACGAGAPFGSDDVIMSGGGLTLVWSLPALPGTSLASYEVGLTAAAGWRVQFGGAATDAQLMQVLSSLESLSIRGDFLGGLDTSRLDDVAMTATARVLLTLFDGTGAVFSAGAYDTLAAALAAAEAGGHIDIAGLPSSTATMMVADQDLTITGTAGFSARLQLGTGINDLTIDGGATFRVIGNTVSNELDFTGSSGSSTVFAQGGSDTLNGGLGRDDFDGGDGRDLLQGGGGNDFLKGNLGTDTLVGGDGNDSLKGGDNRDINYGEAGNDTIRAGFGNDVAFGGDGNDQMFGEDHNDYMSGGAGTDLLDGGSGNDTLNGGSENDRIFGGTGNDLIEGGRGADSMAGGTGSDTFVFAAASDGGTGAAADSVTDFATGVDKIDLLGLGALTFIGSDVFTDLNQVRYDAGTGVLSVNLADGLESDFDVVLSTRPALAASDLILA